MAIDTFGRRILTTFDNGGTKVMDLLEVDGNSTLEGDLDVTGLTSMVGDLDVTGLVDITGGLTVNGTGIVSSPPANLIYVLTTSDLPAAVGGVRTLADAVEYALHADLNLGTDRIVMGSNTVLSSPAAGIGKITTNNALATVTMPGTFNVSTIQGGITLSNTTGPAIRCEPLSICFIKSTLHGACSIAVEIDGALLVDIDGCSPTNAGTLLGIALTGACDTIFIRNFTPFGPIGGLSVNTTALTELRVDRSPMETTGVCLDIPGTVDRAIVTFCDMESSTETCVTVGGTVTGELDIEGALVTSDALSSIDLRGSTIARLLVRDVETIAPLGYSLRGDAASANITGSAAFEDCFFNGGVGTLDGITATDLKYRFTNTVGVPDTRVRGAMFFGGPGATPVTTTLTTGTPEILEGTMTEGAQDNRWDVITNPDSGTASALQYVGIDPFDGTMAVTLDGEKNGGGTLIAEIGAYKNAGAPDAGDLPFNPPRYIELAGTTESVAFNVEVSVVTGDIIDIRIDRVSSLADWDTRNIFVSVS